MGVQMKIVIVNVNVIVVFCEWIDLRLSPSHTDALHMAT